ncbi:DUF2946 family protein [Alicycliphilus denitrificans]|uniref:DUF2946 family protein n=1 Tax=Alicycliphilus denitrificans TaxID=179636 RepID=UPI00384A667E
MDTLRSLNRLRWWVVAWLVFSMGATLASPLVQPRTMELICSSGSSMTLMVHAGGGNAVLDTLDRDCVLCLLGAAPPPPAARILPPLAVTDFTPPPPPDVPTLPPMAAPPPARAPPVFFVFHT